MANNEQSNWLKALVIPIIVAILGVIGTYFIPKLLDKGKRLTYEIDGPTSYANTAGIPGVSITVNGAQVSNLIGYRVRLWNSGDAAIANLPVQLRFSPNSPDFKILTVKHETIPKEEFGKIEEQGSDVMSKRFVYQLINPKDQDTITLVANADAPLAVYSKAEAVRVQQETPDESPWYTRYKEVGLFVIIFLASVFTDVFKRLFARLSG